MKHIYSCLIILTFFSSCSTNETTDQETNLTMSNKGTSEILPSYNANPYDNAGRVYDEIFSSYFDGSTRTMNVDNIISDVQTIANSNSSFTAISSQGYSPMSAQHITYLAGRSSSDIGAFVGASNLSSNAKVSFSNFLISTTALYESESDPVKFYNAFTSYEEKVIDNVIFTPDDKRIILTTASILRYTTYRAKKKPKKNTDPDWIISVVHAFGAEEGAEENMQKAIVESLAAGIVFNK